MSDRIHAPWTDAQIAALNAYQRAGITHPFTCGGEHELHQTLIAERDGWHCPDQECSYWQNWAHSFMAEPTMIGRLQASLPGILAVQRAGDPMAAELDKVRQQLRDTEDQLAAARRRIAELTSRREAVLIHKAITRIPAEPPDPDGGLCEPVLREKPIRNAGSIDTWQEAK